VCQSNLKPLIIVYKLMSGYEKIKIFIYWTLECDPDLGGSDLMN
jgi:hypothetical protein